jgi:hypothetical protein
MSELEHEGDPGVKMVRAVRMGGCGVERRGVSVG